MVPPFLAYYGVYDSDKVLVREAVKQCRSYCEILGTQEGPWKHIVHTGISAPGERAKDDEGLWSTSNGWAAGGMVRVLATLRGSRFADDMEEEQNLLVEMIKDIVCGVIRLDTDDSGLLRNYLNDEMWWGEVSGTALLAATVFRMAMLDPVVFGTKYTQWALRKMDIVGRYIDAKTGIAKPVVNPLQESQRTVLSGPSPEGQAFIVLMYAAWRDWKTQSDTV
jgi:rhamnogalacturonyl hydrolase YesR